MKGKVKIPKGVTSVKQIRRSVRLDNLANREGWRPMIHSPKGSKYTGEWHKNEKHGVGEYITRKDRLFSGYFDHNLPSIFGVSAFGRGKNIYEIQYRGEWKDGYFHGQGLLHFRDKSIFRGTFVHSKREGFGEMWYADGSYYEGDWVHDRRDGIGIFIEPNANRYEGEWRKDKKHGRALFFFLNTGQYMDGVWDHDICITSIMADIPYRQTSLLPTQYTINEVQLDDEANIVCDIIETTLLNLDNSNFSIKAPPTSPERTESKHGVTLNLDISSTIYN